MGLTKEKTRGRNAKNALKKGQKSKKTLKIKLFYLNLYVLHLACRLKVVCHLLECSIHR